MGWLLRAAAAGAILLGTLLFAVNSTIVMKLQPAAASRARSLPRKPAPKSGEEQPPPQLLLPSSPETEAPHAPVAVEPTAAGPPPPPRGGAFHEKYGTVPKTLTELSFDNASRPMTADVVHYLLKAALGHASKAGRRPWWGVSLPALPAAGPAACEKPPLERYQAGARMFHAHKKKRRGEHTPVEYAARMAALAADPAAGVAVAFIEGTQLPSSINEVPILDSKGGRYDVFSRWGDRKLWSDLRWIRRPHPNNTELQKRHTLPGIMPEQPVMWGAVIRNAWVKDGNVFTCTHAFTTGACLWEMKGFTGGVTRVEKVFAFCDKWCRGYFHFTHEHLPRVATMYSLLEADPKVMIAVPTNRDYIVSFFEDVLGIDKTRLIGTGTVFADQVYYPQPQTCGNTWTHTLMLLRRVVFSRHMLDHSVFLDDGLTYNNTHHLAGAPGHNFVVVWAERAGGISGKSRNPTNYEAVKAKLIDDFPNVAFQSSHGKNTLEQVKLFNRAHMVIGPHGANLANIMWCRHGASVVEFMSYKYGNLCYYVTAQRLDLTFRFIMQPANKDGAYVLDYDEIKRHVDDAIRRYRGEEPLTFE